MICWWHTPPQTGTPGPDGGSCFEDALGGEAQETPFMNIATAGLKLHVAGFGRAEEKGHSDSPFPEESNQLGFCGHGVRVENKLPGFALLHVQQEKIFPFRYCVRHISQPADTIRGIPVSGRYRIFHQYKRHATFKTREKGGRHPAFKLQCRIPDKGEMN